MTTIPIEISARHIHLSSVDTERLFGKGHTLNPLKKVSQKGQFACKEIVDVMGNDGRILKKVRIVGPERPKSQVEVSFTDARFLKKDIYLHVSGNLKKATPVKLKAGKKIISLPSALIVAQRHIHCPPEKAKKLGLKKKQKVKVRIKGDRALTFENVVVRIHESFVWAFQIDTDEGNAAGLKGGEKGEVII